MESGKTCSPRALWARELNLTKTFRLNLACDSRHRILDDLHPKYFFFLKKLDAMGRDVDADSQHLLLLLVVAFYELLIQRLVELSEPFFSHVSKFLNTDGLVSV